MMILKLIANTLDELGIYLSRNADVTIEEDIVKYVKQETKVRKSIILKGEQEAIRKLNILKDADKFLKEKKAKKAKKVKKTDPLSQVRTVKENKIAEQHKPQIKISESTAKALNVDVVELQVMAELIETHIVASTKGIDGLTDADYKLDGKTFFTMIVGEVNGSTIYSPSIRGKRDKHQPYSYNFSESYKIHSVYSNRYKNDRVVENRNALAITITIKG